MKTSLQKRVTRAILVFFIISAYSVSMYYSLTQQGTQVSTWLQLLLTAVVSYYFGSSFEVSLPFIDMSSDKQDS